MIRRVGIETVQILRGCHHHDQQRRAADPSDHDLEGKEVSDRKGDGNPGDVFQGGWQRDPLHLRIPRTEPQSVLGKKPLVY